LRPSFLLKATVSRRKPDELIPADARFGFAFNQAINSFRSFAGIVFFAKRTGEFVVNGKMGAKSFNTSYGSEYQAAFSVITLLKPKIIV
jgi:hypothetical protein